MKKAFFLLIVLLLVCTSAFGQTNMMSTEPTYGDILLVIFIPLAAYFVFGWIEKMLKKQQKHKIMGD